MAFAAALGGGAAFTWFQIQLAPDFSFLEWRICTAGLLVVAAVAGAIAIRSSLFETSRTILMNDSADTAERLRVSARPGPDPLGSPESFARPAT